jgi:Flp pilus assembly protein TadG
MVGRVRRWDRCSGEGERGVAIIEAAFAGIIFFLTIFAIVDFSMAFYSKNSIQEISLAAARTAAAQADDPLADYQTLQKVVDAKGAFSTSQLTSVTIYRATGPSSHISTGCKTASSSGACNFYVPSDLSRPSTDFGCGTSSPDRYWCPTSRQASSTYSSGSTVGPEYVGVYVRGSYTSLTGVVANKTFETDTIIRIEPRID